MYPSYERRFSEFTHDLRPSHQGVRKRVYKAYDNQRRVYAAKIFRYKRDGRRINRQREAEHELFAYSTIYNRSTIEKPLLRPFTPRPYFLLMSEEDKPIGIAVAWINGLPIETYKGESLISLEQFHHLSDSLAEFIMQERLVPEPNMYSESNLLFDPHRRPNLAFSKCRFYEIGVNRIDLELDILAKNLEALKRYVA